MWRLIRRRDFDAVYRSKVRVSAGPLIVWGAPNDVGHCRLGFAISRRAGRAVVRNRMRRLLREAFRHARHDLPTEPHGYDLVVSVRPHETADADEYRQALQRGIEGLQRQWLKRRPTPDRK